MKDQSGNMFGSSASRTANQALIAAKEVLISAASMTTEELKFAWMICARISIVIHRQEVMSAFGAFSLLRLCSQKLSSQIRSQFLVMSH